jgi:hypothetical protein
MDKNPPAIEHVAFRPTPPRGAHREPRSVETSGVATPRTLAVDVGGSHVKAIVLSADGARRHP